MSKKVDFTHEERAVIMRYLQAKADKAKAEKAEKDAKAAAKELFSKLGKEFKTTDKTSYLYGTVQVQGKAKPVVYKETTAKGTIDWQAYAMALGGNSIASQAIQEQALIGLPKPKRKKSTGNKIRACLAGHKARQAL